MSNNILKWYIAIVLCYITMLYNIMSQFVYMHIIWYVAYVT